MFLYFQLGCHLPGMIRVILQIKVGELIRLVNVQLGQRADHLLVGDKFRRHRAHVRLDELLRGDATHLQNKKDTLRDTVGRCRIGYDDSCLI